MGRKPDVEAGKWYLAVSCKGCGKPIYFGSARGYDPQPFVGKGKVSIPCDYCVEDTTYSANEISTVRAEGDIKRNRPVRREPSNMPRQPIDKKYPKIKPTFGPGFLEDRPEVAALVGRCIGLWSILEAELARLLAALLGANTEPAIAVFLAIQNARVQGVVLDAAAETVLNEQDYDLFCALMISKMSVEKERNALAHGTFGGSDHIKEGVAWINPVYLTRYTVRVGATGVTDDEQAWVRSKIFVYEPADLEKIARDIESIQQSISSFIGYVRSGLDKQPATPQWRAERYAQLCDEPRTRQALDKLFANRKKNGES